MHLKNTIFSIALAQVLSLSIFSMVYAIDPDTAKILQDKYGIDSIASKNLSQDEIKIILKSNPLPEGVNPFSVKFDKNGKIISQQGNVETLTNLPSTVDCFDYYKFGSVSADMTARSTNGAAGSKISFSGSIKNTNPYPVVDGTVYVKIFKVTGNGEKNANGPEVVDQFVALKDISIPANGEVPAEFSWNIPLYTVAGNYRIATFFETAQAFNLLGLSFTDDVVGNTFDFKVQSENKGAIVSFNKSNVTINDKPYYFASFPPKIDKSKGANISAEVKNTTSQKQFVNVVWTIYRWDSLKKENVIRTETKTVEVKANSSVRTSILVPDTEFPVYLVEAKLGYRDTSSILNIRFVRQGVDLARINFPSITSYPLVAGKATTVFSCLHNSGSSSYINNGKLVLSLLDKNGNEIHHYEYGGKITGDMMGVKSDFTPSSSYNTFSLKADLYQNEKLVDSATHYYDCAKLGAPCSSGIVEFGNTKILIPLLIGLFAIIIGLILVVMKHKIRNKALLGLAVVFVFSAGLYFTTGKVEAKSVTTSTTTPGNTLAAYWNRFVQEDAFNRSSGSARALSNIHSQVTYIAEVRKNDGTLVEDGATVAVGTVLNLIFKKHLPEHVYWFGSGFSEDSPYGEWRKDSTPPALASQDKWLVIDPILKTQAGYIYKPPICDPKDFVGKDPLYLYDVHIPLVVNPPEQSISNVGDANLTCGTLSTDPNTGDSTMSCTVNSFGKIKPVFHFAPTTGVFYYRYFDNSIVSPGFEESIYQSGCYGNQVPLFDGVSKKTYLLPVGAVDIPFTFSAVPTVNTNTPPTVSISGPTTGFTNTSYDFTVTGNDVDTNDKLTYFINWNNDKIIANSIKLSPENVNRGTSIAVPKSWSDKGIHNFSAIAWDGQEYSQWTTHSIDLSENSPVFDYTLMSDGIKEIYQGQSLTELISSNLISGSTKDVTLSATITGPGNTNTVNGLGSIVFNPLTIKPAVSTSDLSISSSKSTNTGLYTVVVTGKGPSPEFVTRTTTFQVNVIPPIWDSNLTVSGESGHDCVPAIPSKIFLSWSYYTSATSYNLYRSINGGSYGITPYVSSIATLSYTDTAITPGVKYSYKVVPVIGAVEQSSTQSNIVSFTGPTLLPCIKATCIAPSLVTVPSSVTNPTANVQAQVVYGVSPYYYQSTIPLVAGNNSVDVQVVDSIGQSTKMTCSVTLTIAPQVGISLLVKDPFDGKYKTSVSLNSGASPILIWKPANATSCKATGAWSGDKDAANVDHIESQSAVTSPKTYSIQCKNDTSISAVKTVSVYITGQPSPTPSTPPNILNLNVGTVAGNTCGQSSSANLSWSPYPSAVVYKVFRKVSGGSYSQISQDLVSSSVSYNDGTGLNAGTKYYYQVKAVLADGSTYDSDEKVVTGPTPTTCPNNFSAVCTITSSATIPAGQSSIDVPIQFSSYTGGPAPYTSSKSNFSYSAVGVYTDNRVTVYDGSTPKQSKEISCGTIVITKQDAPPPGTPGTPGNPGTPGIPEKPVTCCGPTITTTTPPDVKMWLKNPANSNDETKSSVTIKTGQDALFKWKYPNGGNIDECKGYISHTPSEVPKAIDYFIPNATSQSDGYSRITGLGVGTHYFSMVCRNMTTNSSVTAYVFNGFDQVPFLTITVKSASINEQ